MRRVNSEISREKLRVNFKNVDEIVITNDVGSSCLNRTLIRVEPDKRAPMPSGDPVKVVEKSYDILLYASIIQ